MNVIINGVSSDTINGLQILELPPITKPKMRRTIDTIDGRAGDIVTKLGYDAYDKRIEILLHDTYSLDEVVTFFNSSGEIVFSNDPGMVYRFQVIEAIDFERAVKFKTATITFHVQPYKTSADELPKVLTSAGTVTNSGTVTSAPTYVIEGSGTVEILVDSLGAVSIDMTDGSIVIDSDAMEASFAGSLKNRRVTGSYKSLWLTPGDHTISWSGTVTSVTVTYYSRWI